MKINRTLDRPRKRDQTRGESKRVYGAYPALVVDIRDPENHGRVKVRLPWNRAGATDGHEVWARLATLMAGDNRGSWFVPEVNDQVLVCFEAGDPRQPYVIGSLWNESDTTPVSMDSDGLNVIKTLRSRTGLKVTLQDTDGQESIALETPGGQQLRLEDGPGSVRIQDSNGNSLTLNANGITVTTAAKIDIEASTVQISSSMVTVNAGMTKFSGVVQADTVISNSVVSSSYTPGAGNIW